MNPIQAEGNSFFVYIKLGYFTLTMVQINKLTYFFLFLKCVAMLTNLERKAKDLDQRIESLQYVCTIKNQVHLKCCSENT